MSPGIKKELFRADKVKHAQKLIPVSYVRGHGQHETYVAHAFAHRSTRMWHWTDSSVLRTRRRYLRIFNTSVLDAQCTGSLWSALVR